MGILFDGKQFFGFIDFGDVETVLPSGAIDRTMQGLGFLSSHDGSQAITFYTSNVRAVCNNTVTWGLRAAKSCVRIRHTAHADERMSQVREILGLAYGNDQAFTAMATQQDSEWYQNGPLLYKKTRLQKTKSQNGYQLSIS